MREPRRGEVPLASSATPSLDLVFDLLSNRRRRYALYFLYGTTSGVATVDEIAEQIVTLESERADVPPTSVQVLASLTHVHLPKLAEAGVLEYDARSETVRYWGQPSLEEWLEHAYHKELVRDTPP